MKKKELEKIDEHIAQKKKIPKEVNYKINDMVFENLTIAVVVMFVFTFILFGYTNIEINRYLIDLNVFSIIGLIITLVVFEIGYKKDSGKLALHGVEALFISFALLSLPYILTYSIFNYTAYTVLVSLVFSIYCVIKSICIVIREQKKYRASQSDITEIIKKGNEIPEKYKRKIKPSEENQKNKKVTNLSKKKNNNDNKEEKPVNKNTQTKEKNTEKIKTVKKPPKQTKKTTDSEKPKEKKANLPKKTNIKTETKSTTKKTNTVKKEKKTAGKEKDKK